jgi:hypothetical protein
MLRPQLPNQEIGQEFVGLGWFCSGKDETFRFSHDGGNNGYMATMLMLPAIGKGAVVMVNSIQGWMLRSEIAAAIGREYDWPALKANPKVGTIDQEVIYAGTYEKGSEQIRITPDGARLLVEFPRQEPIPLYPSADGEFFGKAINVRLRFGDEDSVRPSELTVIHGAKTDLFKRTD